jgi:hypothetical protein
VDDAASLDLLLSELAGRRPGFSEALRGAYAPATRAHLAARAVRVAAEAVK